MDLNGYGFNGIGSLEEYFAYDIDEYYESIQMARKGGHVALISIPAQDGQQAALKSLIMNQITLHGVRANPNCSKTVLDMMSQGILPVEKMITHRFPLEQIHEAFDTFTGRKDGAVKVVVHPND